MSEIQYTFATMSEIQYTCTTGTATRYGQWLHNKCGVPRENPQPETRKLTNEKW